MEPRKKRPLDPRKRFVFLLILIGIFLVGQELVLRVIFPLPEVANFNRVRYSQVWFKDGDSVAGYLSNTAYLYGSKPDDAEFTHTLNLYGFRDRDWSLAKPEGHKRIAIIGDSFVEGAMAPDDFTIPEGFRQAADEAGHRYDVMNLGVQATGPIEYMMIAADAVPLFNPDYVLLVFYENDFYDLPSEWAWPLDGTIGQPRFNSSRTPRLVHLLRNIAERKPNPTRWTSGIFRFFGAVPDERNPLSDPANNADVRQFVDADLVDAMETGDFNPYIADLYNMDRKSLTQPINLSSYLLAFQDWLTERNVRLLTAYIPINHQISDAYLEYHARYSKQKQPPSLRGEAYRVHARSVATICDVLDIPFLDLTSKLEALESAGHRLYWNYDNHMRGEAYFLVGQILHQWFQAEALKAKLHNPSATSQP